jgi:hypothetical protein
LIKELMVLSLTFVFSRLQDFMPVFMSSEVLTALAGTLFPMIASAASTPNDSPFNSPDREQSSVSGTAQSRQSKQPKIWCIKPCWLMWAAQ